MPHLTLEYTTNIPTLHPALALAKLHRVLMQCGHFDAIDIKSRALPLACFAIGEPGTAHAFVHAKLAILSGRTVETKADLSRQLLHALQAMPLAHPEVRLQLCVEVQEIERSTYAKAVV